MTETFWIAATVLIILALAFVLYPVIFYRPEAKHNADLRNQNLMAYRTRMKELDDELAAGILDEENYGQLKEELAGTMLDDIPEHEKPGRTVSGRRSAMVVSLLALVLLPPAAFLMYQEWGAMDQVEQFVTMKEMQGTDAGRAAKLAELADTLRAKLDASPDNPDGWAMLGQTYMRLERYGDAGWAFRKLADSVVEDSNARSVALGLAAQAFFFQSKGEMSEQVTSAIDEARSLNPDEVNALGLLGIHAFSQEKYPEAIRYWERIVEVAPEHPQLASIQGGINAAYRRMGQEPPAVAAAASGPGVTVRVSLAEDFRDQVPADTTLFVFARQVNAQAGPPLAIARLSAADLPAEVRLDDSHSMSPQARISSAGEVLITARLSRSGSAMPQAGDWQGSLADPVPVVTEPGEPAELVIDTRLGN